MYAKLKLYRKMVEYTQLEIAVSVMVIALLFVQVMLFKYMILVCGSL